jgi:hypothetical protein
MMLRPHRTMTVPRLPTPHTVRKPQLRRSDSRNDSLRRSTTTRTSTRCRRWSSPANPDLESILLENTSTYTGPGPRLGYKHRLARGSLLPLESGFKAAVFVNPFSTYETSADVLPLDIGSLSTNSTRHTPSDFTLNGWYASCSLQWRADLLPKDARQPGQAPLTTPETRNTPPRRCTAPPTGS